MTNKIQPIKMDNNFQSQDETPRKILEDLFTEIIAPYLECKDLEEYIKTGDTLFQDSRNYQVAFKAHFKRDFGIALAQYIKDGKWQDAYYQTKEKIQRLNTLSKEFLSRFSIIACIYIPNLSRTLYNPLQLPFDATKYISSLSDKAFSNLFKKTAIVGWTSLLNEIIKSNKIKNISSEILTNVICSSAENGRMEIVKLLIENNLLIGKDLIEAVRAALCLSAKNGHMEIVKLLIESNLLNGRDLIEAVEIALRLSIQHDHIEIVKLLIENNSIEEKFRLLRHAFFLSFEYGRKNIVELLIEKNLFNKEIFLQAIRISLDMPENLKVVAKFLAECRDLFVTNFGQPYFDFAVNYVLEKAEGTNQESIVASSLYNEFSKTHSKSRVGKNKRTYRSKNSAAHKKRNMGKNFK